MSKARALAIQILDRLREYGCVDELDPSDVADVCAALIEGIPAPETGHPMQPLVWAKDVIRFKRNEIVRRLLDYGGIDLNQITLWTDISEEDRTQFTQLIGYSVSGAGDLNHFDRDTLEVADAVAETMSRAKRSKG